MTGMAIYVEGGGTEKDGKAALRQGMTEFLSPLRKLAHDRGLRFHVVPCGPRGKTWEAFQNALDRAPDWLNLLLVDSEGPVKTSPIRHLAENRWHDARAGEDCVHMMVQTMETWIVADPEALKEFYKQGFVVNALPKSDNLEIQPKDDISKALKAATKGTQKGEYHKTHHGPKLLERIDREKVKKRCPACHRLFSALSAHLDPPRP